jgi:EAL domain-containing protein (putative c-di-GMP-specific phosphodiesterase class I)
VKAVLGDRQTGASSDPLAIVTSDGEVGHERRTRRLEAAVRDALPESLHGRLGDVWSDLLSGAPVTLAAGVDDVDADLAAVRHLGHVEAVVVRLRQSSRHDDASSGADATAGGAGDLLSADLRAALLHGDLRVHYQPIVALDDARPVGSEALVRWQHPHRGLVGPVDFIEMAERSGLVVPVGAWVLHEACRTAAADDDMRRPLTVTVNLSARQLADPSLFATVRGALDETGCPPERLVFEVTETAVMADLAATVATLTALKAIGVGLAIDDFGTGYSSLLYLKHFPVDAIKIDRTFVAGMGRDPDDTAIVAATISLAHAVNVRCVAEGVETVEHLDLLRRMECDYAQGFLFSRPLELQALRTWFDTHLPRRQHDAVTAVPEPIATPVRELLERGASLHTIAAALNASGSRTAKGTRWTSRTVAHVITAGTFPDVELPAD